MQCLLVLVSRTLQAGRVIFGACYPTLSVCYAGDMADGSPANVAINAASELPACDGPGAQGLLGLRLGGLFGILLVSTIGVFIPFFTYKAKFNSLYFLLRAFAAGVVLTTGYVQLSSPQQTCVSLLWFCQLSSPTMRPILLWLGLCIVFYHCRYVHVLGDAYPILTDPCLGLSSEYPWAMTIATAASLFTFVLQWVLHKKFHERLFSKAGDGATVPAAKSSDVEAPSTSVEAVSDPACCPIDNKARLRTLQNTVISYTFEAGIIFHSECALFCHATLKVTQAFCT